MKKKLGGWWTARVRIISYAAVLAIIVGLAMTWDQASVFTQQHYWLLVFTSMVPGTLASGAFIAMHRPSKWFDRTAINASGWLIIVFIFYLRSIVTLLTNHHILWRGMPNALWGLGTVLIIDALMIFRLVSFIQFRRTFRRRRAELEREHEEL